MPFLLPELYQAVNLPQHKEPDKRLSPEWAVLRRAACGNL